MRKASPLQARAGGALLALAAAAEAQPPYLQRVLVYSKNTWHHNSIPFVAEFVKQLGQEKGFQVDDAGVNAGVFTDANLARYDLVVLNNNVGFGNTLNEAQKAAFQKWYEAGGGIVGFHAVMDHLQAWPWFSDIAGTRFQSHSDFTNAILYVPEAAQSHPILRGIGQSATVGSVVYPRALRQFDEYYNYANNMTQVPGTTVLLQMAHGSYLCACDERVMTPTTHQAAWIRQYRGGRQFVTTLGGVPDNAGHVPLATFPQEPTRTLLHRAFQWAAGDPLDPVSILPRVDLRPAGPFPGGWDLRGRAASYPGPVLRIDAAGFTREKR